MPEELRVRVLRSGDRTAWLRLRSELWYDHAPGELAQEVDAFLRGRGFGTVDGRPLPGTVLLAEDGVRNVVGFAEVTLRPLAEGCSSHPVGYLEGWYVVPGARRRGVGGALVRAAEQWARARGCSEMASDTLLDNQVGERSHRALGFEEVHRTIHFRKSIPPRRRKRTDRSARTARPQRRPRSAG